MHVAGDMAQRQQISPLPYPRPKAEKLHGEHADHVEAASWNGPAHADQRCTLEETPETKEKVPGPPFASPQKSDPYGNKQTRGVTRWKRPGSTNVEMPVPRGWTTQSPSHPLCLSFFNLTSKRYSISGIKEEKKMALASSWWRGYVSKRERTEFLLE